MENFLHIHHENLIKTTNFQEKKLNFKPEDTKLLDLYSIVIESKIKINIQFKFNFKFMKELNIINLNKKFLIKENNYDGILISVDLEPENKINISFVPKDHCSCINIWDINVNRIEEYTNISWDKIYIINLERRTDRKIQMEKKLKDIGLNNYEFVNAVDGKKDKILNYFSKLKKENKTNIINSGHFGCLLSHIKVIKKAIKNNHKKIMILEDDIIFEENFIERIKNIKIPKCDLIYLSGPILESKLFISNWAFHKEIMGTYGYILDSKLYTKVIDILSEFKYTIDISLIEYIQSNYNVVLLEDLVKTKIDDSDTSNKNKLMNMMIKRLNNSIYTSKDI